MTALAGSTVTLLRMLRIAQQRDQTELARMCGTTPTVVVRVESGEQYPDLGLVLGLCWHLRVRPNALLGMAESRTFAFGSRRPGWDSPGRVLAAAGTNLAALGQAHRDGPRAARIVDQGRHQ
jgi:DNA-binding XRE family transcriptional regulator